MDMNIVCLDLEGVLVRRIIIWDMMIIAWE